MSNGKINASLVELAGSTEGDFPVFGPRGELKEGGVSTQAGNDLTGFSVWKGTSVEYAALAGSYDSNTLYLVT